MPFVVDNELLYKQGVVDVIVKNCCKDTFVYIYYDLKYIKNLKSFIYYFEKEKYYYNSYFDKFFIVKLKIDEDRAWYIYNMYHCGPMFISKYDYFQYIAKKIPAARESSRDLFYSFILIIWFSVYVRILYGPTAPPESIVGNSVTSLHIGA